MNIISFLFTFSSIIRNNPSLNLIQGKYIDLNSFFFFSSFIFAYEQVKIKRDHDARIKLVDVRRKIALSNEINAARLKVQEQEQDLD